DDGSNMRPLHDRHYRSRTQPRSVASVLEPVTLAVRCGPMRGTRLLGIVLAIGAGVGCTSHPSSSANSSNVAANHSSVASASATSVPAPGASIPAEDPAVVTAIGPKLLQPDDVGLGGVVDWVGPVPSPSIDRIGCGVLNPQFSPSADLETGGAPNEAGVEQHKAAYGFFERVLVYADEATASHAVDAETARIVACLKPNTT